MIMISGEIAILKFQKDNGLKADGIVGNQSLTALKTLSNTKDAPDSVKNSAKASIANAAVGDIKDNTILMSTNTFNKALENVAAVRTATGGGSVQTEVKGNKVVITGATVGPTKSDGTKVKVATGKDIQADSDNLVPVEYPHINSVAALALGFDSGTGGMGISVINTVNTVMGKPLITQEAIDYNKETTYGFEDNYKAGNALGGLTTLSVLVSVGTEAAVVKNTSEERVRPFLKFKQHEWDSGCQKLNMSNLLKQVRYQGLMF